MWPPVNASLSVKSGYDHGFRPNRGAGRAIAPDLGLFQTWQFSLYKNLMARLRTSARRTRDPSKASAFVLPFDAGVHSYIDHEDGRPRLAAPHGRYVGRYLRQVRSLPRLLSTLGHSRFFVQQNCQGATKGLWWKNNGHDHFIIFSITAYQMVGMMVKVSFLRTVRINRVILIFRLFYFLQELFMFVCQNCTTIIIETTPTGTAPPGTAHPSYFY